MTTPVKLSNGCVDVLVVQQQDKSFKSTPFQIAFASIKPSNKIKEVSIEVNGVKSATKMYVGKDLRPKFEKKKILKRDSFLRTPSDSEEVSDDDRSERSTSNQRNISPSRQVLDTSSKLVSKSQKLQALKNEVAPTFSNKFWPFAWLSKTKEVQAVKKQEQKQQAQPSLSKIQEQIYQGQDSSTDPQFLLSVCGHILRKDKNSNSKQILQTFYAHQLKYKDFIKDPLTYLSNQDLVVKINDEIYTWDIGLAIITSKLAFGKIMSDNDVTKMMERKKSWISNYFSSDKRKYVIETDDRGRPLGDKKVVFETQVSNGKQEGEEFILKYSKTPSSQQIEQLGLNKGSNTVKFTLDETGETVECHIFLWDYKTKIVVSDIDGTITKTDVFGQLMPVFNHSWIHDSVVKMFNKIERNGYQIVYLTARAIVQYNQTRQFLFNFVKEGEQRLPLGPVFTSPDGLFTSFKREVIDKQPDFLKTQILTAIKQTYPLGQNPLIGGFGNKKTDATSYKNSGIKLDKIFIIGENSVVNMITNSEFKTTYDEIAQNVNKYFPQISLLTPQNSVQEDTKSDLSKVEVFDLELSNIKEKGEEKEDEESRRQSVSSSGAASPKYQPQQPEKQPPPQQKERPQKPPTQNAM